MSYNKIKIGIARLPLFIFFWLVLTMGSLEEWPLALIFIVGATAASAALWPERRWRFRLLGVARFAGYFLVQSTHGGWDVARRALRPSMPLDPGFVEHRFEIQLEEARVFFAWTVSLLPGTASASLRENSLLVHALDRRDNVEAKLRELEIYVAGLFKNKNWQ